jgi:UDP-N-acetylglucosamine--N-acetylmuramyl-(pentapeptide) pyrophosphoryl-undecaprenol N-acetylglucosamine transferase
VGGHRARLRPPGRPPARARARAPARQGEHGLTDVVIAGGGTGGHTSPGLAVGALLRERGLACAWIGSRTGVESRVVPERGFAYHAIPTGKLRRYWAWANVADLAVNVPAGTARAFSLLRRLRPRVVFGTGGFVALPVVIAAAMARVPVVIHEQTAVPGLANRIAARFARRIAVTFAGGAAGFPASRVVVTGNPVRPELRAGSRADAVERFRLDPALPLVYVTGGAQGAQRINRAVGAMAERLLVHGSVIHQCGDNPTTGDAAWLETVRAALPNMLARRYTIVRYVGAELGGIYAAASLVIGRAGAGTVNECCHLGVPALYVPLPGASGDEQTANARLVADAGGCAILPQFDLTPEVLLDRVLALLAHPLRLKEMGERARTLAVPDAAERIVRVLVETWSG